MTLLKRFSTLFLLLLCACASVDDPLVDLQRQVRDAQAWSIILHDMRQSGTFDNTYEHRYKLVTVNDGDARERVTDWLRVPSESFERYADNLGMTIRAKTDEGVTNAAQPTGYQYVGNPQYGSWVEKDGTSFWEFYAQYAILSTLFGSNRVERDQYRSYQQRFIPQSKTTAPAPKSTSSTKTKPSSQSGSNTQSKKDAKPKTSTSSSSPSKPKSKPKTRTSKSRRR